MKLWKLYPRPDLPSDEDHNPWEAPDARVCRFVVRAESADDARRLAARKAGGEDEVWVWDPERARSRRERRPISVWVDPNFSVCEELTEEGLPGIVLHGVRVG
jgi:hypothetical protein